MIDNKEIVVTGLGVAAPNGIGAEAFEQALRSGRSGIRFIEALEQQKFGCQVAGTCQNIDQAAEQHLDPADLFAMSEGMKLGAIAAYEAVNDSGLKTPAPESDEVLEDTGALIGTGIGGLDVFSDKVYPAVAAGKVKRMGSSIVEQIMVSGVSAKIGGLFGLGNQVSTNSSACSTGTEAIIMGAARIKAGLATRMLVGGVEAGHPHIWAGFDSMKVLSRKFNDRPEQASRPMSASACGFVPGSGAGILVIEEKQAALARGAKIYAEIIGTSLTCGGMRGGGSMTAPSPSGVRRCIRQAMLEGNVEAKDIDYINGHLTATMADPRELKNWQDALEITAETMPKINSTKSMIGHALGAAGAIETVAALIQLEKGFIHKSINCEDLHEQIKPYSESVVQETIDQELKIVAKASFGFGDVNSCLIFRRWI